MCLKTTQIGGWYKRTFLGDVDVLEGAVVLNKFVLSLLRSVHLSELTIYMYLHP